MPVEWIAAIAFWGAGFVFLIAALSPLWLKPPKPKTRATKHTVESMEREG